MSDMDNRTELTADGRKRWTKPLAPALPGCQLGRWRAANCSGKSCEGCGWSLREAARRTNLIRRYGLVTLPDGTRRLVIRRET